MTYQEAFDAARHVCSTTGRTMYVLQDLEGSDGPSELAYEYADTTARVYLYPRARVIVRLFRQPPDSVGISAEVTRSRSRS